MTRSTKFKILWSLLSIVAAFALFLGWVFLQFPKMGSVARLEPVSGIVGVETGGSYAWLIRTPHGVALVDAGMDTKGTAILAELDRQHLTAKDVHTVLITHGHFDHICALPLFPQAKIWVGPGDAALIRGERKSKAIMPKIATMLVHSPPQTEKLDDLANPDTVEFDGEQARVIHTPGHTPGSTMFLYRNILFTGDSIFVNKDGLMFPPTFICDDPPQNRASARQLISLSFDSIADGHVGFTGAAYDKLLRLLQPAAH